MFVRQVFKDSMLAAVCFAAAVTTVFIRFGVPLLEGYLCAYLQKTSVLADYYLLFDLLLALIVPYLLCFASAMMMLTEYDENITAYLAVTPVGKPGYILSRIGFVAVFGFAASAFLLARFSLTAWPPEILVPACLFSVLTSMAASMLLFSFSHNRVEGLALGKLSGLLLMGMPVPFFVRTNVQYLFSPLPSFWLAKFCLRQNTVFLLFALLTALAWILLPYRRFGRKLT
jgi:fluoroquinolone transport system permease protein